MLIIVNDSVGKTSNTQFSLLHRGHRYLSTKQTHKHSQGSSSESPVHGSPLPLDTPTSPTDTPTFTPFLYKLNVDQPNQSGLSLVEEQKEIGRFVVIVFRVYLAPMCRCGECWSGWLDCPTKCLKANKERAV